MNRVLGSLRFASGWTVQDLITALDITPDGRAHRQLVAGQWVTYSAADGIPPLSSSRTLGELATQRLAGPCRYRV